MNDELKLIELHVAMNECYSKTIDFIAKYDDVILNESIMHESAGSETIRHLLKVSKEKIHELTMTFRNFIQTILSKIRAFTSSMHVEYLLKNENKIREHNKTPRVLNIPYYDKIDKRVNIDIMKGVQRLEKITDNAILIYQKNMNKAAAMANYTATGPVNPFEFMPDSDLRASIIKGMIQPLCKNFDTSSLETTNSTIQHSIVGEKVSDTISNKTLDIDELFNNIKTTTTKIERVENAIPQCESLLKEFERIIDDIPSQKSFLLINVHVTRSISDFISILRVVINALYNRYIISMKILSTLNKEVR